MALSLLWSFVLPEELFFDTAVANHFILMYLLFLKELTKSFFICSTIPSAYARDIFIPFDLAMMSKDVTSFSLPQLAQTTKL
ncbi:hypothetical protein RI049_18155 [Cedecea neteri]|uniref:hypothetical protein n=1 Tax=Cedecea neteri TaxID=158822 RepID=UPI002AA6D612|nr:hypothetical protein [Cedecea neteri]WPU21955.1 hypothetical protein RI049_18155 [Cedecea neteri]